MGIQHRKRIGMSSSIRLPKKFTKWIAQPKPGTHKLEECIALSTLMKEFLNLAQTTKEVKHILNQGKVKVDNIVRKDHKFAVGLMDVISFDDINKHYRILFDLKGRLLAFPITKKDASIKPRKLINKKIIKGKKMQLNLSDGFNLLKEEKKYKVNDTLIFNLNEKKIKEHLTMEKGQIIYIADGSKRGLYGKLKEIKEGTLTKTGTIIFNYGDIDFETKKDYAFVIGKTKSEIALPQ